MYILGISSFGHDSAAALVRDGEIVAAAQEERFTRKRHDGAFPLASVRYCLAEAGIPIADVGCIACAPFRGARKLIRTKLQYRGPIILPDHHLCHAASAFYPSPFKDAVILTVDGAWGRTVSSGEGHGASISVKPHMRPPHSLGILYSAFTHYLGFRVNSGEYKVMGLAPYGRPVYKKTILKKLISVCGDGTFTIAPGYVIVDGDFVTVTRAFCTLFGLAPRKPGAPITKRHADIAASIQRVTEEVMLAMARHARRSTGARYLTLAGATALNCVANGRIAREAGFRGVWVQPASGNAAAALGAALLVWYRYLGRRRRVDGAHDLQKGSLLGPAYSDASIRKLLERRGAAYRSLGDEKLAARVADLIAQGKVVGWFQGRMEFGPRALGARSIIADPRSPRMKDIINKEVKLREPFRPFAPSVLEEKARDYFDLAAKSPYMLLVAQVRRSRRTEIPSVTHVDHSARVQTVSKKTHPLYYLAIKKFYEKTGCPVIINTSFNVGEEPIVASPEDAYRCFGRSKLDCLVMGHYIVEKKGRAGMDPAPSPKA